MISLSKLYFIKLLCLTSVTAEFFEFLHPIELYKIVKLYINSILCENDV